MSMSYDEYLTADDSMSAVESAVNEVKRENRLDSSKQFDAAGATDAPVTAPSGAGD